MLSLQSFLREGRVVGPRWEKLKPKGPWREDRVLDGPASGEKGPTGRKKPQT